MSCSPAELKRKSDEFFDKWAACKVNPGIDGFVEFAVAVSSFTEFLEAKGLPGLHQSARSVEQLVLSQFAAPPPAAECHSRRSNKTR